VDRLLRLAAVLAVLLAVLTPGLAAAQGSKEKEGGQPARKAGVTLNDPKACQGYTLLAPLGSTKPYLIDMQSRIVKT
jgi:hypothetical protein